MRTCKVRPSAHRKEASSLWTSMLMWCRMGIILPIRRSALRACRSSEHRDGSVRARDPGIPARHKAYEGEKQRGARVLSVPAQKYESGNIALAVDLEPLSEYNILLIGDNETLVTIPLEVRRAGDFVHTSKGHRLEISSDGCRSCRTRRWPHPSLESKKPAGWS